MNKYILLPIYFLIGITTCNAQEFIALKKPLTSPERIDMLRQKIHDDWFGSLRSQDLIYYGDLLPNTVYRELEYKLRGIVNKGFISITNRKPNTKNRTIDEIVKSDLNWCFQETTTADRVSGYVRSTIIQAGYYFDNALPAICIYFLNNNTKELVEVNIELIGTKDEKIAFTNDFIKKHTLSKWKIKI